MCQEAYEVGYKEGRMDERRKATRAEQLQAENERLRAALEAFVEAWEKSLQLEKTDVALRMAKAALSPPDDDPDADRVE